MSLKRLSILFFTIIVCTHHAHSCLILVYKDANHILVANHEDWFANDAAIRINPPTPGRYGSITFTFLSEGWAQGGMNEKGLFFDAAQTPYQDISFDSTKRKPTSYPWQEILDKAGTVQQALNLLQNYALDELEEITVMLADATGEAVILGVHDHRLDIRRPTGPYLIQTNFNQWHPELSEEPVCKRYETAEQVISAPSAVGVDDILSVLKQTHQDSMTVYSNLYDLKNKTILTYNKRDFENAIVTKIPNAFEYGECLLSLDSLAQDPHFSFCTVNTKTFSIKGRIVDENGNQIPYVNIGLSKKNIGTLSDPDGSFEIDVPSSTLNDSLIFSSVGFETLKIPVNKLAKSSTPISIKINSTAILLKEVTVSEKRLNRRIERLGWMGGKDGILPFDTIMGGGAVALLVESPKAPFLIEKLQVRLMYNSKDTLKLRFHVYEFDSINKQPGKELLTRQIILKETKRFGWLRFDLSHEKIILNNRRIFIAFEWIDERDYRLKMLQGLRHWERWKESQFRLGNKKVEFIKPQENQPAGYYKYHGNMMDWPGFKDLPPFTGLMVESGKRAETEKLLTFERKTSFGEWKETPSTLNAVITIIH